MDSLLPPWQALVTWLQAYMRNISQDGRRFKLQALSGLVLCCLFALLKKRNSYLTFLAGLGHGLLSPSRMWCCDFILSEICKPCLFLRLFNLRNLLYSIQVNFLAGIPPVVPWLANTTAVSDAKRHGKRLRFTHSHVFVSFIFSGYSILKLYSARSFLRRSKCIVIPSTSRQILKIGSQFRKLQWCEIHHSEKQNHHTAASEKIQPYLNPLS